MNGAGRNGPGRNGTLSPISTVSSESTLVSKYQPLNGADNPYSPGLSSGSYGGSPLASPPASSDGRMSNAMRDRMGSGNPSPPSSVARSSDGNGLYSAGMSQEAKRERAARLEEALQEHYTMLKGYLASQLRGDLGARPNKARDKLLRLSMGQFEELSTDVYDELRRREDMRLGRAKNVPRFLLPIKDFHPKRNQARQKLATLPPDRFRQLATDVFYELERRFPRFSGRPGSPTLSIASSKGGRSGPGSMGPPRGSSRAGGGPPPSYRPSPPGSSGPGMSSPEDDYGKPLPKQFQQNTIVPNKSTMVEDESGEEEGETDLYDMSRLSKPSVKSGNSSEGQISQLENKVDELEAQLREKDAEMQKLRSSHSEKEDAAGAERAEWDEMRGDLERKLADAQTLNESIQSELERFRTDSTNTERELRVQLEEAREAQPTKGFDEDNNDQGEWQQRYETLQQELYDQEQIIDEVRREAKQYLAEMRSLSTQSSDALESESRLIAQVHSLEAELQDWKTRYAKARTQLRHLRTSSLGLASQPLQQAGHLARNDTLVAADGLVADVHVTRFQLSVDELLATARQPEREGQRQRTLDAMKGVVMATRAITADCDAAGIQTPTSAALVSPEVEAGGQTPTTKNP
ncbi:MAG: hypothetical protein Q9157_001718, partial [Trypethelium eluteriae]